MLAKLTLNEEGIRQRYRILKENKLTNGLSFKQYKTTYNCVEEDGFYFDHGGSVPSFYNEVYNEFTKKSDYEEGYEFLKDKRQYGVSDNLEQIKEYFKDEIADPNVKYAIFLGKVGHEPENAGKWGGFRPYKHGPYIGRYSQIAEQEYYNDCKFDKDYQGYVITFHLYPVI